MVEVWQTQNVGNAIGLYILAPSFGIFVLVCLYINLQKSIVADVREKFSETARKKNDMTSPTLPRLRLRVKCFPNIRR